MSAGVTSAFTPAFRVAVEFSRGGGRDKWGQPLPSATFEVPDCLFQDGKGGEEDGFLHVEGVQGVIYAPTGTDVRHDDRGVVPATSWLPRPVKFTVAGDPQHTPLGVAIPIRREA